MFELTGDAAGDIATNIVGSVLFALLGALFYRYAFLPAHRRAHALARAAPFELSRKGEGIVISYGLLDPSTSSQYYMVEEGDLAAINHADSCMAEAFGRDRVHSENCFVTEADLGAVTNMLAISGPRWNRITETYLGRLGSPVTFDQTAALIVAENGQESRYVPVKQPGQREEVCFGAVVAGSVTTSTGRQHNVAICAGLNNLSTYGAVVFLMSLRMRVLFRNVAGLNGQALRDRWAVVLRVENTTNLASPTRFTFPLDPDHIKIDVVTIIGDEGFVEPYVYHY